MKVRACSGHAARLSAALVAAAALKSGYFIARSGITESRTAYPAD